jgi:hemerythrin-like domain-containing protein
MRPTEILSGEHRVIEVVLDCLKRMVERSEQDGRLDKTAALWAVDIIRNFADRCHHGKEEKHLFAALVEKGLPEQGGPVGQMLHEHELGRDYVRGMDESIAAASEGKADGLITFSENARNYIELLRHHIQKEDGVLFPVADRLLDDSGQQSLLAAFAKVESEHMGSGTHEKYLNMVKDLARRFNVPCEHLHGKSCHCGH